MRIRWAKLEKGGFLERKWVYVRVKWGEGENIQTLKEYVVNLQCKLSTVLSSEEAVESKTH